MNSRNPENPALAAKKRVDGGLEALRVALRPYVERVMKKRYAGRWRHYLSRADGGAPDSDPDVYALLKTVLAHWRAFSDDERLRKVRSFISLAMDARNSVAHFAGHMSAREAIRYLDAMRELALATGGGAQVKAIKALYREQVADVGPETERAPTDDVNRLPIPDSLKLEPWREVCQPHADVLSARFSEAEFAANLALVDQGEGSEEYVDPAAFFRITYATQGLTRVLTKALMRLADTGGDPVIGLQTSFGGGKTHTMLAIHHLAGASQAGYRPADLAGMAPVFEAAGVDALGEVRRAVFVGTHKGVAEAMHAENGREVRTLWGYLAWRLGGWEAVDHIADSELAGTNPGSERLVPILRDAAPCIVLLDEVVAFARQLRGLDYDAFHAFMQSLTEAAAAVDGAVIVASLPESGIEVGNEQGRDALRRLEKIFGRVQSAWTPASGVETFEIVRRRLFQPLDRAGEKARDRTIDAFRKLYRDNRNDFPAEVRKLDYAEEMRRAYPLHPEILRRFSGDWSILEKFQRTRGILKIMADVVYAHWRGDSQAPLVTPALLPFDDPKVRTALLEPLEPAFGPILQQEVDGDLAYTARIEARRPRLLKTRAATRAARAVFFATAPHAGARQGGVTGSELRLACAQPGDQISIFAEALEALSRESAHLYRDGDSYWYSPHPTLNKLAADRARDVREEDVDARIAEILRKERKDGAKFARIHAAPDDPTDVEDRRSTALVVLPPSVPHDREAGPKSPAVVAVREALERRGARQRTYRNALVFVAADARAMDGVRETARRERAWRSILDDAGVRSNMTRAQESDAKEQAGRSRDALRSRVRQSWAHALYPEPRDGKTGEYSVHSTRIVNRKASKSIPRAVWDKVARDGIVIAEMGHQNLVRSMEEVWPDGRAHVPVARIRDWFASLVHMPRLLGDATLYGAIKGAAQDLVGSFAFATAFDAETGLYDGVIRGRVVGRLVDWGQGLLVRREAIPTGKGGDDGDDDGEDNGGTGGNGNGNGPKPKRPARFRASVRIDPERAGLEVSRIMDDVLVELTGAPGSKVELTLEIDARAGDAGYPADVVETVSANLRDLKIDPNSFDFEID